MASTDTSPSPARLIYLRAPPGPRPSSPSAPSAWSAGSSPTASSSRLRSRSIIGAIVLLAAFRSIVRGSIRDYFRLPAQPGDRAPRCRSKPSRSHAAERSPAPSGSARQAFISEVAPSEVQTADDVAHREDADRIAVVEDDQVADAAARHLGGGVLEAPVGGGGDHAARSCGRRPARRRGPRRRRPRSSRSRSVTIPGVGDSSSMTSAAPVPFSTIFAAASRSVCDGPTVSDDLRHAVPHLHLRPPFAVFSEIVRIAARVPPHRA